MAETIPFVVVMLIAIVTFEATLGFALVLLIYGPGAYAAIAAGWYAAHFGAGLPLAITMGLATGLGVRRMTLSLLRYVAHR